MILSMRRSRVLSRSGYMAPGTFGTGAEAAAEHAAGTGGTVLPAPPAAAPTSPSRTELYVAGAAAVGIAAALWYAAS